VAAYFQSFAEDGDPRGMIKYGTCLEHDCGVRVDLSEAARWYRAEIVSAKSTEHSVWRTCLRLVVASRAIVRQSDCQTGAATHRRIADAERVGAQAKFG
jgi:hypothetical protein